MDAANSTTQNRLMLERLYISITQHTNMVYSFLKLPSREENPDYYEGETAIENPIAMNEIRLRINENKYSNVVDLKKDIKLLFANAQQYNPDGSQIHEDAVELEAVFDLAYIKIQNSLGKLENSETTTVSTEKEKPKETDTETAVVDAGDEQNPNPLNVIDSDCPSPKSPSPSETIQMVEPKTPSRKRELTYAEASNTIKQARLESETEWGKNQILVVKKKKTVNSRGARTRNDKTERKENTSGDDQHRPLA